MSEPTTETGKRLLDEICGDGSLYGRALCPHVSAILAIEAEALAANAEEIAAGAAMAERARLYEKVRQLADRELAEDAAEALHCIWPSIHLRVLALLEPDA